MIDPKYVDVIENAGWRILDNEDDVGVELEQYSPAGEDFVFYSDLDDFPDSAIQYARDFDVDAHVEENIPIRGQGGCPSSIIELVDDARAIRDMLNDLADALEDRKCEEQYIVYRCPDGSILLDWNDTAWTSGYPAFSKERCVEIERGYCKGGPGLSHFYAELKIKYDESQIT